MKIKSTKSKSGKNDESSAAVAEQPEGARSTVPLNLLVSHDDVPNRPLKPDHVAELKESIRKNGLDVPLIVWDGGEPGTEMEVPGIKGTHPASFLVAGGHRRKALQELSKEDAGWFKKNFPNGIPVVFRSGDIKEVLAAQLRENVNRDNPDAAEILPQVKRLQTEFKMKPSEIAKAIGKSKSWISGVMDIENQLGKSALKAVAKGKAGLSDAIDAARKVKKDKTAGKKVSVKKVVSKIKAKTAAKKASGKKRSTKRAGAATLHKAYTTLPAMSDKKKVKILEGALAYLAGEEDDLPEELQSEE